MNRDESFGKRTHGGAAGNETVEAHKATTGEFQFVSGTTGELRRPPGAASGAHSLRESRNAEIEARAAAANGLTSYLIIAGVGCIGLFFVLWWIFDTGGDETPWLPAGLIASITLIALVVAREIVKQRIQTRAVMNQRMRSQSARQAKRRLGHTLALSAPLNALRTLERRLLDLDDVQSTPAQHLEAYRLCDQYLTQVADTLPRTVVEADVRAALRAGVERVRVLQRRHLLAWARKESQQITADAQRSATVAEKISTAERALAVLNKTSQVYPNEPELAQSAAAVREFIASVSVVHWVELAEREVFKGNYEKAIDHYRDALFDLSRADMGDEVRRHAAERITREVQLLLAHRATTEALNEMTIESSPISNANFEVPTPETT